MVRKPVSDIAAYASLTLEGNLIAPAMIAAIDQREAQEQDASDYGVRKGLNLRDEISTAFRVGQAHYDAFAKQSEPSAAGTTRFVRAFLLETFGFDDISTADSPIAFAAGNGRVPVVVVPPLDALDRASPSLSTERRRSAAFALQDCLNEREEALWGIATNGNTLRLMRDNASLTRPAYIEASISQIFETDDIASFAVLWLLIHRTRFGKAETPATDCALERWRDAGAKEGIVARDKLATQVEEALKLLGTGFLEANPDLRNRISSGQLPLTDWFNELLRLVYRMIFLMVAEDRNLLHTPDASNDVRRLYREGYSISNLRENAIRRSAWDQHHDRYEGLKIVFKALAVGEPRLGLPPLGGIFNTDLLPSLVSARINNRALLNALYHLSWLTQDGALVPVNWRLMETEELGSVYESLLELQPQFSPDGKQLLFAQDAGEQKGNQRKTTGSYYTPDSLVQELLDTALDPVLDKTETEATDPAKALLKLAIIDPACGSGHFLLAAARRMATRLARIRSHGTPSLADFRHALRDVARCCIHGVDRNPMAVELTKVALWIETVDPGLPLGFFDAQICCGDALIGVFDLKALQDGIPDAAYKPLATDDKDIAKYYLRANRSAKEGQGGFDFGTSQAVMPAVKPMALDFSEFRNLPEDTMEQISTKVSRFQQLHSGPIFARAKTAADLYVAAFLLPKNGVAPAGVSARSVPTTEELWMALSKGKLGQSMTDALKASQCVRAFHWPLEFPDVMQNGGFDVVLGNPPWEKANVKYEEFFQANEPSILEAQNDADRDEAIEALRETNPRVYFDYQNLQDSTERKISFIRNSGFLPLTSNGFINYYSSFAELMLTLLNRNARAGIILQSGIATDKTNEHFFKHILSNSYVLSLFDFVNAEKIFNIDPRMKFSLVTLAKGMRGSGTKFAFNLKNVSQIKDNHYELTYEDIALVNPSTFTCPVFTTNDDARLVTKIYKNSGLFCAPDDRSFAPSVSLHRMFNATTDQKRFLVYRDGFVERVDGFLPVYEAKLIWHFDHRLSTFDGASKADVKSGNSHYLTLEEKRGPENEVLARWMVDKEDVKKFNDKYEWQAKWYLTLRMITSASNERTLVASLIPEFGSVNSLNVVTGINPTQACCLIANINSLVVDYVTRTKVNSNNLNQWIVEQLPVIGFRAYAASSVEFIVSRVLELSYTSDSLKAFARDLGYCGPSFAWDEDRRAQLRAELDAFYARAYRLTREELCYVLDPADAMGSESISETFRVLKDKEMRKFGEYRTRRLILSAWDRMEANDEFTAMGI